MNVYLIEDYKNKYDRVLLEHLLDCYIKPYRIYTDPLKENSLFIVEYPTTFELLENRPDLKDIKNKRILIIFHYKSLTILGGLGNLFTALRQAGFSPKNIYIITQLEYDRDFILRDMPGVNIAIRDRWLLEMFERKVNQFAYNFHTEETIDNSAVKRFSIFIRRFEIRRFTFMCDLIANNLLGSFIYTFVNYFTQRFEPETTTEQMKSMIPERLSEYRNLIEPWIDGIPYKVKPATNLYSGQHEYDDYPLNLDSYFKHSRINIVFETEPDIGYSFITEKTYKAMLFKKPFIIVSRENSLKALRKGGYKTFGHVINESYDEITDYEERTQAILREITRLNNLSEDEFNHLVDSCASMVEHNHDRLYELAYTPISKEFCLKALTTF